MVKKNEELARISTKNQTLINYLYLVGLSGLIILAASFYRMYTVRRNVQDLLLKKTIEIEKEKKKSDDLLLNILPSEVAEELKKNGKYEPRLYEDTTIMLANLNNFDQISMLFTPKKLVEELDFIFSAFDEIIRRNNLEKIKAIGSFYLCVSGVPDEKTHNPMNIIRAAKELQEFILNRMLEKRKGNEPFFEIKIGIHTGPLVAGIIGAQKFAFDIWGEALTIVNEVEKLSGIGKINISYSSYSKIKDKVICEYHGNLDIDSQPGEKEMYHLISIVED